MASAIALSGWMTSLFVFDSKPAAAAQLCQAGVCSYFIPQEKLPQIESQQTPVWCWAAAAQAIFRYYGHRISQQMIVSSIFGSAIPTTATADVMLKMLNATYTENNGERFAVSTPYYVDQYGVLPGGIAAFAMQPGLTNSQIFNELAAERPLLYSDGPHVMVLVGGTGVGAMPTSGMVLDPAPMGYNFGPGVPAIGLRSLRPQEMKGYLVAEVRVTSQMNDDSDATADSSDESDNSTAASTSDDDTSNDSNSNSDTANSSNAQPQKCYMAGGFGPLGKVEVPCHQ